MALMERSEILVYPERRENPVDLDETGTPERGLLANPVETESLEPGVSQEWTVERE